MQGCIRPIAAARLLFALTLIVLLGGCSSRTPYQRTAVGHVAFHDTHLMIAATVDVGGELFTTDDGRFAIPLRPGRYNYTLWTMFGSDGGEVAFRDNGPLRLEVPPFLGWSPGLFDNMAFTPPRDFTTRWERGRDVKIWIQPFTNASEGAAVKAFREWQTILHETITFSRVYNIVDADITMRFVPASWLPGYRTIGTCTRSYRPDTGLMVLGEIQIARSWADHLGLHRHEIGHCLGLGHSPNKNHLMYPVLNNYSLSPVEENIARLLYSIPPKTGPLEGVADETGLVNQTVLEFYSKPGGDVIVETIR